MSADPRLKDYAGRYGRLTKVPTLGVIHEQGPLQGYHFEDPYCRLFWLPVLGPSAFVIYQHLCDLPSGPHPMTEVAAAIGVGRNPEKIAQSVKRIVDFSHVWWASEPEAPEPVLCVPYRLRPLSEKMAVKFLTPHTQERLALWHDSLPKENLNA